MERMGFEDFKKWAAEDIKNHLPEEYKSARVRMRSVRKLGSQHTGMSVISEGQSVAAEINLNELYELYLKGTEPDEIMDAMAKMTLMRPFSAEDLCLDDYEKVRSRLFVRLSYRQTNQDLLEKLPHRVIEDMALTYHVLSGTDGREFWSAMISRDLLECYGISEEQLHEDALKSSSIIMPPRMESAGDSGMVILTNQFGINGASVILYPGVLEMAAEKLGGNIYIIPSSIHEVLLAPVACVGDPARLAEAIYHVNTTQVEPRDLLSFRLYHYDTQRCQFETADLVASDGRKQRS